MLANVGEALVALHSRNDAPSIDLMRRRGYDFTPAYEHRLDIEAWTVPIWRNVVNSKGWVPCVLSANGRAVASLAISSDNIVVEV
jgi:hypothetical protein